MECDSIFLPKVLKILFDACLNQINSYVFKAWAVPIKDSILNTYI